MSEDGLFPVLAVHCFLSLSGCAHVVRGTDVDEVHDRMEAHYAADHRTYIDAVAGRLA